MCPACLATAALITAGVTSAGGATSYLIKRRQKKKNVQNQTNQSNSEKNNYD